VFYSHVSDMWSITANHSCKIPTTHNIQSTVWHHDMIMMILSLLIFYWKSRNKRAWIPSKYSSDGADQGRVANQRPVATVKTGRVRMRLWVVARRDRSWICNAPQTLTLGVRGHSDSRAAHAKQLKYNISPD